MVLYIHKEVINLRDSITRILEAVASMLLFEILKKAVEYITNPRK